MVTKNILLFGGSGKIGEKLVSNLSSNYNVFSIDKNLKKNLNSLNIKYIKYNLLKNKSLLRIPKKIDSVIFLVGHSGGPDSIEIKNLKKYIDYNCETLINFLSIMKKRKILKIIFTSTEHVYGDNAKNTSKTKLFEPNPKNYYGVSKLLAEKILYNFYFNNLIDVDILRIPRVIFNDDKNLISSMIVSSFKKNKIYLSPTKAKFNFIYSDDLMDAFEACLIQKNTGFRILNIFNNSMPISPLSIAKVIKTRTNKKTKIFKLKKNNKVEHNPLNLIVSNSYSNKDLKWKPKFNNNRIINKLIKFYETKNSSR